MLVVLFHKSLGMVESTTMMVILSSNTNYSTWKTSCKITLIRDALWGIVNETIKLKARTSEIYGNT